MKNVRLNDVTIVDSMPLNMNIKFLLIKSGKALKSCEWHKRLSNTRFQTIFTGVKLEHCDIKGISLTL